jgi:hypothetical protein
MMALKTLTPPTTRYRIQQNQFFSAYVPQLLVFVASPPFHSNPKIEENFCIATEVEKDQVNSPAKRKGKKYRCAITIKSDSKNQLYLNNCGHITSSSRRVNEFF